VNIVFISQYRDTSGYASAARGYLKAIDDFLTDNPGSFNFKIHTIPVELDKTNRITKEEKRLIEKYEFKSEEEIDVFCKNEYLAVWQMPAPMVYFLQSKKDPVWAAGLKLIHNSTKNINISVWEADALPDSWKTVYKQLNTESVIVPCEWNKNVYSHSLRDIDVDCHLLPYVLNNNIVDPRPIDNLEEVLKDKFVVFSMSQWTMRKGFEKLVSSFAMEFANNEDAVLIIKTYINLMPDFVDRYPMQQQTNMIAGEIKKVKSEIFTPTGKQSNANIMLLTDTLPFNQLSWLYNRADLFALLTRAEGYGLTVAEALMHRTPVLVPGATGYMDFAHQNAAFFVDGHWKPYTTRPEYHCDMNLYEPHILSARKELRRAYEMWRQDSLEEKGWIGWEHMQSLKLDQKTIGQGLAKIVMNAAKTLGDGESNTSDIEASANSKTSFLKSKINSQSDAKKKVDILKDSFKGQDCYILSCGPSLKNYSPEFLREKLKDKLVIAIKQAYDYVPDIVDFHLFNCNNFKVYDYKESQPVIIATAGEPEEVMVNHVWTKQQEYDIFLPIVNSNKDFNHSLAVTRNFDDYVLEKTTDRLWGPGMMYEIGLYLVEHLGISNVHTIGWDFETPGETKSIHFYDLEENVPNVVRRSDPMRDEEIETNIEASKSFYEWLKEKNINLHIAAPGSHVHENVPRKYLEK